MGFAFAVTNKTAVRGGYGIFFAPLGGAGFNGLSVPNSGFTAYTPWVSTLDGITPLNPLSNSFPQGFILPTGNSQGVATQIGQSVNGMDRHRPVSYAAEWNVDVQQTLPDNFLFDIAYTGSHGVHLYGDFNPNQVPDQYLSMGNGLLQQVANPFSGSIPSGALSGSTVAASQLLRPFPQFTGVTIGNASFFGASSYNAMQLKAEKRYSQGFNLLLAYTWSKLMDNIPASETGFPGGSFGGTGIQDWDNLRAEWAIASFDTRIIWRSTESMSFHSGRAPFLQSQPGGEYHRRRLATEWDHERGERNSARGIRGFEYVVQRWWNTARQLERKKSNPAWPDFKETEPILRR